VLLSFRAMLANPYEASGVKRADGCVARMRGGRPNNIW
jgi:hypothetical protein